MEQRKVVKDIRTFCRRCAMEYFHAGYELRQCGGKRSTCDKCHRQGINYELLDK